MAQFCSVLIFFTSLHFIEASTDPCKSGMLIHENGGRSTECKLFYEDTCDAYLIDGWYRFQLAATGEDLRMATEVVPQGRCGTVSPVWMNGRHPNVEDGIVDRVTCLNNGESTCYREYKTTVKNCGGYMVYYLIKTLGCKERYCFGNSSQCHVTTTTTTPTTTTTTPTTTTTTPTTTTTTSTTTTTTPTTTTTTTTTTPPTTTNTTPTTTTTTRTILTILPTSDIPIPNIGKRWYEPRGYDDHGEDDQLMGLTITLSVTVIVLIVALVGILLYIKLYYRPIVKQTTDDKINGVNVLEKPHP